MRIIAQNNNKQSQNKDGIVLITVTMIIIVMTMLGLSILGLNMNQIMVTESEIERIQAETMAMGMLHYQQAYQEKYPGTEVSLNETFPNNGPKVSVQTTKGSAGGANYPGSDEWDITITY